MIDDDTVIGTHRHCDIFLYLSDLEEPYQRYFRDLHDNTASGSFERAVDRIAELEAEVKHVREGVKELAQMNYEKSHKIESLEAKLAKAEAALGRGRLADE